jgi:23S rRNA pseudouridine1911/1915/1917 synthase
MQVLYEDNHLLVVNKPPNWIVQGAGPGQKSLIDWAANYLRDKYNKPGNVFVGVVSRLDALVTGVLPLARTSKCASRLSEQFRNHTPNKIYWAIVENCPKERSGTLEHFLARTQDETKTRVVSKQTRDCKAAILEYQTVGQSELGYQLEIKLITGRKHQIRAQLEAIGCSIVGDRKYGSHRMFPYGIALHCRQLEVNHPTLNTPMQWVAPLPVDWKWSS